MLDPLLAGLVADFILEAREHADRVERAIVGLADQPIELRAGALEHAQREIHTLKGNAGMMGFDELRAVTHAIEDRIAAVDLAAPAIEGALAGLDEARAAIARIDSEREDAPPDPEADVHLGGVRVPFAALDLLA